MPPYLIKQLLKVTGGLVVRIGQSHKEIAKNGIEHALIKIKS
jgi:hypothetical protein